MTRILFDTLLSYLSGKYRLRACPVRSNLPHLEVGRRY